MIGNRRLKTILGAVLKPEHYTAFANMFRVYTNVPDALKRYLFGSGEYPTLVGVKTPIGVIKICLYSHFDILTVNEIFCRKDYKADPGIAVVVDIGSNIGISALYFLTRNRDARCYLFEPDPKNVARLQLQLEHFADRYQLTECAVADYEGLVTFGVETSGRYGGIGVETGQSITVQCRHINSILAEVIEKEGMIDIVKIDTEGVEIATVKAMDASLLKNIRRIFIEAYPEGDLLPLSFAQRQYGPIAALTNRIVETSDRSRGIVSV
jgi:FkbM family methyltransferase